MRNLVAILTILGAVTALAQDEAPTHLIPGHTAKPKVIDKRPVTSAEALTVLKETRRILGAAIGPSVQGQVKIANSSTPVTREQIVQEFARDFETMRPQMKFTPNLVPVDGPYIKISASVRPELVKLIQLGFVGRVAPLATGPQDTIGVSDFGDAVGFFVSRMAQVTHMPNPKWSPMLGAGGA